LKNDGLLAPATAWIRKKYEFFSKLSAVPYELAKLIGFSH
jgi:hypothetical protein